MNTNDGREYYGFGIDNGQLRREANEAVNIIDGVGSKAEAEGARIDNAFRKAGQAIAAYFTAQQLSAFVSSIVKVRSEIESLEISFETLLGNKDKAAALFGEIKSFAVNTPMQLGDLAKGAQTLLAFNIEAERVMPTLRQIGDISMGSSEKFNSLILAFAQMSSTGKLMGQDLLQMINAGFNPLVEISKTTGKSISDLKEEMSAGAISAEMVAEAFAHAAGEGGTFNGMLEKQSHGLKGAISNLQGAIDDMLNDIGSKQQGVMVTGITLATNAVKNYESFASAIISLAAAFGTYKAILIATDALERAKALADNIRLVMMFRKELGLLTAAQQAFNTTAWSNPYVLLASVIVGAATALYLYADNATNAEKAQEKLNEASSEWEKHLSDQEQRVNELLGIIQDKTETDLAQLRAYEELKQVCPAITNAYTQEALAAIELTEARKLLNESQETDTYDHLTAQISKYKGLIEEAKNAEWNWAKMSKKTSETIRTEFGTGLLKNKVETMQGMVVEWQKQVDEIDRIKKEAEERNKPIELKIAEAKADLNQIQREFDTAKEKYEEEQAKLQNGFFQNPMTLWYEVRFKSAQKNLKSAQSKVDSLEAEKNSQKTYKQEYEDAKNGWEAAKKELDKINSDKSKYTAKQYKDAAEAEEKARKTFKNLGGDPATAKQAQKEREEYAKKNDAYKRMIKVQATELARAEIDAENMVEQSRINAMQAGTEKIKAQMALTHKMQLEQLNREKEDYLQRKIDNARALFEANPANKGKTFDGSGIALTSNEEANFELRRKYLIAQQSNEGKELVERQRTAMNEYLKEYGDYMQKRQAIVELYNDRIKKAETDGEKNTLTAQMKDELADLDAEANKSTSAISRLFEDMRKKTVKDMRAISSAGEQALKFLLSGEWDAEKGIQFGMTQETFDKLRKSPEELDRIRKAINGINESADKSEKAFKKMATGLDKIFNAGKGTAELTEGLELIESGMNDVLKVGGFLSNALSDLGSALGSNVLGGIADGVNVAMGAMSSAMSGAQAGAVFGPWGAAAGAAIGLVSSLGSALAKLHDKKHEKRIQKIQEQIDVLNKSYEKLGGSIEKSYSKDASKMIEQQNTLLEQQKLLIKQQIREEESKKKTDHGRIEEWKKEIEEINRVIDENKEKAIDAIFGQDLKSAIDNFADAYANAWAANEDKAESAKDAVRKMMRQMVTESIKAAIQSSGSMERIRKKLQEFYADNVLSGWEQDYVYKMAKDLQNQLDKQFGWADSLMKDEDDIEREGVKKGIATASQESVDENNARLTTIQGHTFGIKNDTDSIKKEAEMMRDSMRQMVDMSKEALGQLHQIARNTSELFETNRRLKAVEESLDEINTRGVTIRN